MFRAVLIFAIAVLATLIAVESGPVQSCCPAPPSGKPVVNADQTVILLWDAATKTEHFIRRASFKSEADDFGFLIPSPSKPELAESGNDAFPTLQKLTEPEVVQRPYPKGGSGGCACDAAKHAMPAASAPDHVSVLEQKVVAGFDASVLEATSATALTDWLRDHGYAYSPEIAVWAKPYVDAGWKVTALKVAKSADGKTDKQVTASALRLSFQTDRPLFPYREPDPTSAAQTLGANHRLLRIYFLSNERVRGEMTKEAPWTGRVAWAGRVSPEHRTKVLEQLRLPDANVPKDWWLTEFEDNWPYKAAPADVYFARDPDQREQKREPIAEYVAVPRPPDGSAFLMVGAIALTALAPRWRRWSRNLI
ncbi:MAG TPA: DUF2330 domain-containing protein [Gemmataceae bacterium]|jgi:hypothetical protein|nr:DUF2330 domain-containing protein [Gemmataceae bacterium]